MNPQKTDTEQKNKTVLHPNQYPKTILYQLESIVKTLYPNYKTSNPYEAYLSAYYEELEIEDVLLFKRLLTSITLLNHKERSQVHKRYVSSYSDVLMAIELISRHKIDDVVLKGYVQLKEIFRDNNFTKTTSSKSIKKIVS